MEDSTVIESLSSKETKSSLKISNPSISSAFCGRSNANTVNCVALVTTLDQSLMLLKMPGNLFNQLLFYIYKTEIKINILL